MRLEFGKDGFTITPLELIEDATSEERLVSILAGIFRQSFNLDMEETFVLEEYIKFPLNEGYKHSTLADLGLYFDIELDSLQIFKRTKIDSYLSL